MSIDTGTLVGISHTNGSADAVRDGMDKTDSLSLPDRRSRPQAAVHLYTGTYGSGDDVTNQHEESPLQTSNSHSSKVGVRWQLFPNNLKIEEPRDFSMVLNQRETAGQLSKSSHCHSQ